MSKPALTCFLDEEGKIAGKGAIQPKWFMSDDANQYFNAWVNSFGPGPQKLLCTWHVERSWRCHLKAIVDSDLEGAVYKQLKVIMQESNKEMFENLLKGFLSDLKNQLKTKVFGQYFERNYVCRKEQWAFAYRAGSEINTNMFVKAFHRVC